ncbi:sulfotransferase family protein [Capilliphycus salinus ALCB114379]|uniref:sulfotransferase family protein n=1 Tax=Capilliphycus salinus TaxID=2768948 RepID=UPI0039A4B0B1
MLLSTDANSIAKNIIYVTGLPRSGSTLTCQLLGEHPDIYSPGYSSPLLTAIRSLQTQLSDNEFLLSQLDNDFDVVYQRLLNAYRGFINGWFAETEKNWVVDKHRGWLNAIDLALHLDPNCRMVACVRELGQVYGSIEAQHQKTLLLDFPDDLAGLSRYGRAERLFASEGVIGGPLKALEGVRDLPESKQKRVYYIVFEHLVSEPVAAMRELFTWLGLPDYEIDPNALSVKSLDSDSYYRYKYLHKTGSRIVPPTPHEISPRIQQQLQVNYRWFYEVFYPGQLPIVES